MGYPPQEPKYIIVRMSNPRSRVPADQAINGEIFVVPKGFIMDLSQDVSSQVDVSVAACFFTATAWETVQRPMALPHYGDATLFLPDRCRRARGRAQNCLSGRVYIHFAH